MTVASTPRLISPTEAAKIAGVTRTTVLYWLDRGYLTTHTRELDGKVMVDEDELRRKIQFKPAPPPEEG